MRKVVNPQMKLGEVDISKIEFNQRSRDEIPKLLMGLQYIYCTPRIRNKVFKILEEMIPQGVDTNNGRPGMELWKILVLGTLRLICNWDYDKLEEIANEHNTLRQMLGHNTFDFETKYHLQTLKDNISLFTPEILDQINIVVVESGHNLVKKKSEEIKGRCDSFVVETNVHYPTDINLLFDAIRMVISLIAMACVKACISIWRQSGYNIRKIKKLFRKAQKLKHSTSKNSKKKADRKILIKEAHQSYIDLAQLILSKVKETIKILREGRLAEEEKILEIEKYIKHGERQIDQIKRRVLQDEIIPHDEKVFSIFEEHTEWICKGKAGVHQELGLRVCILNDQYGFILNHQVMRKETDDKIAVSIVKETKEKFPELNTCSFDKGFYSPDNKKELAKLIDNVILPKKGKLSAKDKETEYSEEFIQARKKHSGIESAINALENHSLDRCSDRGIEGFERYVSLSVLARNIQIIGNIIQLKNIKKQKRKRRKQFQLVA